MKSFEDYLTEIYKSSNIPIHGKDPLAALYYLLLLFEKDFTQFMEEQRRQMTSVLELEQHKWQEQSKVRAELIIEKSLEIAQKQSRDEFDSQTALLWQKINEIFNARMAELKVIDARLSLQGKLNLVRVGGLFVLFCAMLIFF